MDASVRGSLGMGSSPWRDWSELGPGLSFQIWSEHYLRQMKLENHTIYYLDAYFETTSTHLVQFSNQNYDAPLRNFSADHLLELLMCRGFNYWIQLLVQNIRRRIRPHHGLKLKTRVERRRRRSPRTASSGQSKLEACSRFSDITKRAFQFHWR